jgi:TPR repeat protein
MNGINKFEYDLLLKLSEDGDVFAMRNLLSKVINDTNQILIDPNKDKLFGFLKILADNNDSDALLILGAFHYSGETEFVEQNYEKAVYYYNESMNKKQMEFNFNTDALNNLGYCFYYGRTGEKNYKEAFLNFGKAAYLDHPNAMYKIGDMYNNGIYVEKNIETAFYWYKKSFNYSKNDDYINASVAHRLGIAYMDGEVVEKDLLSALKYLQIAEKKYYKLAINRPILSNSLYVNKPLNTVKELLIKVKEMLDELIE